MNDFQKFTEPKYSLDTLKQWEEEGIELNYIFFKEEDVFGLSAPCSLSDGEHSFLCLEHYLEYRKAESVGDFLTQKNVWEASSLDVVRSLMKRFNGEVNEEYKKSIYSDLVIGNYFKFHQNDELKKQMTDLKSETVFVYLNSEEKDLAALPNEENPGDFHAWKGKNLLGFALMEVRDFINQEKGLRIKELSELNDSEVMKKLDVIEELYFEDSITSLQPIDLKGRIDPIRISLPDSIEVIPEKCFVDVWAIVNIKLPKNLKKIEKEAFRNQPLPKLELPEGLLEIGESAFYYNGCMRRIHFPKSLKKIEKRAFDNCFTLKEINGFPNLEELGEEAFYRCEALEEVTLPKTLKKIGDRVFRNCYKLKKLVLEDGLKVLGKDMFLECGEVSELIIPGSVGEIPEGAFRNSYIEKVIIGEGVTKIGDRAFEYCVNLKEISLPASLIEIGENAFAGNKLCEQFRLPKNLKKIGNYAFSMNERLEEVELSEEIESLGVGVFSECKYLTRAFIHSKLKCLPKQSFNDCINLHTVVLPSEMEEIDDYAFLNCKALTEINLPESLRKIGDGVFQYCNHLSALYLPKGLREFGNRYTFYEDRILDERRIILHEDSPYFKVDGDSVLSPDGKTLLKVMPNPSINTYKLPSSVEIIEKDAFYDCSIKEVLLHNGLKRLTDSAFSEMRMKEVLLPASLECIEPYSFKQCRELKKLVIGKDGILQESALAFIPDLEEIHFLEGVKTIPKSCCFGCTKLKKVVFPQSLERIEKDAFRNCRELKEIEFQEGLKVIEEGAFYDSRFEKGLSLPKSLVWLGKEALGAVRELTCFDGIKTRDEKGDEISLFLSVKQSFGKRSFRLVIKDRKDEKELFSGFVPLTSLSTDFISENRLMVTKEERLDLESYDTLFEGLESDYMKTYFAFYRLGAPKHLTKAYEEKYRNFFKNIDVESRAYLTFFEKLYRDEGVIGLSRLYDVAPFHVIVLDKLIEEEREKENTEGMLQLMNFKNTKNLFFEKN